MRMSRLHQWPRRPALAGALATVAGVAAAHSGEPVSWLVALLALALVCLWLVEVDLQTLCILLLFVCLGYGRCQWALTPQARSDLRLHSDSQGQVIFFGHTDGEAEVRPDETRWIFRADSVAYPDSVAPRSGRLLARFRFDPGIPPDSKVKLAGRFVPPDPARNPGDFSWSDYLRRKGLHGLFVPAQGSPVLKIVPGNGWRSDVAAPLRRALVQRLVSHLDSEEAALAPGLLLGLRNQMSESTVDAFRRTGTLHLLAVSGSNVGIVAGAIWGVLLFFRFPNAFRLFLSAAGIMLFCGLAYLEASVVRAGGAALIVLGGVALRRRVDPLQVWGLVLLAFVLWEPASLLDVGCQLSFGATLGILLLPQRWSRSPTSTPRKLLHLLLLSLLVSTAAQLGTLPTLLAVFHEVPLVTPLANLVCVPLAGLATLSATLQLILAPLGEPVLSISSAVLWISIKGLLMAVHGADRLAIPILAVPRPGALGLVLLGAGTLALFTCANWPRAWRRVALTAPAVLALAAWVAFRQAAPEVVVLDAPEPVALVRMSESETWLVGDSSGPSRKLARRASLDLGWSPPDRHVVLQDSVEAGVQTANRAGPYGSGVPYGTESSEPSLVVWCRSRDSLPFGVVVTHSDRQVVICQAIPGEPVSQLGVGPGAVWVTRSAAFRQVAGIPVDRFILTGRIPGGPEEAENVHVLHTRRLGSIRIRWRDYGFQTEPGVR